jgi:hypothetical protein
MPSVQWVTAAAIWGVQDVDFLKPCLVEFDGDRFLPDFLDLMASQSPADLASNAHKPKLTALDDGTQQLKLYQPLHGAYYLVTGSLVCRKLGLPDRTVLRKNGEKTSFVLRRTITDSNNTNVEYGWVKDSTLSSGGSWLPVGSNLLLPNEERQPMHPVKTCAPLPLTTGILPASARQTACDQRTVYYGYIPVASREKYLTPIADPVGTLQSIIDAGGPNAPGDPRLDDLNTRVIEPWLSFYIKPAGNPSAPLPPADQRGPISFYLLLDLLDFLQQNLHSIFEALGTDGSSLNDASYASRKALFNELRSIIKDQHKDGSDVFLSDLLNGLKPYLPLVQSQQGNEPADLSTYNLYSAQHDANHDPNNRSWKDVSENNAAYLTPPNGAFYKLFSAALEEEKKEKKKKGQPWLTVPPAVSDMLKEDPATGDMYFIRLVYEHDPCTPVLSQFSDSFTFARFVDPDAPARHIHIELPSIKPRDLRKFKHGVGMEMSPELCGLMNSLTSPLGILSGGGISLQGPCGLGSICSFSIQILFIIAFILMFIFLILLNIVFWWIAFFRICFPVPKKITG